jgi:hypothetical protein
MKPPNVNEVIKPRSHRRIRTTAISHNIFLFLSVLRFSRKNQLAGSMDRYFQLAGDLLLISADLLGWGAISNPVVAPKAIVPVSIPIPAANFRKASARDFLRLSLPIMSRKAFEFIWILSFSEIRIHYIGKDSPAFVRPVASKPSCSSMSAERFSYSSMENNTASGLLFRMMNIFPSRSAFPRHSL